MADSSVSQSKKSGQVKKICATCGKEYYVKKSQDKKSKYCSKECRYASQKKMKVELKCAFCGNVIYKLPSQVKQYTKYKSKNFYCNKDCQSKHCSGDDNPNRREYKDVSLLCLNCGKSFYLPYHLSKNPNTKENRKFCSRECYIEYAQKESNCIICSNIEVVCSWCGRTKIVSPYHFRRGERFFCDFKCQGKYVSEFLNGEMSNGYKGGYEILNKPSYDTYASQIDFKVETRRSPKNKKFLEIRCSYCGVWFEPERRYLRAIISSYKFQNGDLNFYCSNECKKECPVFWQRRYPKSFKKASSREVFPDLRQMCFERDNWECQKCGATESLHCHHIDGAVQNKIISNDLENTITLCKKCHKEVHMQDGCKYHELQCSNKEQNKISRLVQSLELNSKQFCDQMRKAEESLREALNQ